MPDVLVYGDEHIESIFSQPEQLAIFFAAEPRIPNGLTVVPTLSKKELRSQRQDSSKSNFISESPPS